MLRSQIIKEEGGLEKYFKKISKEKKQRFFAKILKYSRDDFFIVLKKLKMLLSGKEMKSLKRVFAKHQQFVDLDVLYDIQNLNSIKLMNSQQFKALRKFESDKESRKKEKENTLAKIIDEIYLFIKKTQKKTLKLILEKNYNYDVENNKPTISFHEFSETLKEFKLNFSYETQAMFKRKYEEKNVLNLKRFFRDMEQKYESKIY